MSPVLATVGAPPAAVVICTLFPAQSVIVSEALLLGDAEAMSSRIVWATLVAAVSILLPPLRAIPTTIIAIPPRMATARINTAIMSSTREKPALFFSRKRFELFMVLLIASTPEIRSRQYLMSAAR